ncbi:alpha/beta hydrolase family protein [Agromyces sp. M3QZ16-3]|uniref:alpha/beta hydrolase family protein n=1 Tax=Agromyces sp. M3QZ16-3 TaxID=3447585 RepID=UPI003F690851
MRAGWSVAAIGAAAAVSLGGLGLVIARRLTAPAPPRRFDLVIREVTASGDERTVVLDRTRQTIEPGWYSLLLERGGLVRLGSTVRDMGLGLVGRKVVGGGGAAGLVAGDRASWSGIYYSEPSDAGLNAVDVDVPTSAGPAPAWLIEPASEASSTWAIHIHGLGSPRAGTLRGVQVASELGLTSLVVTYRNDREGPWVGTRRSTLGATEIDDVRSALDFARANGARRFVVFGWSMGGAIALQLAADPRVRPELAGLVLESPVLDWVSTIKANCVRAGLPGWAGLLAIPWLDLPLLARLAGLPSAPGLDHFDWVTRAAEIATPILVLHGAADTSSPFEVAARLARLRPDLVTLESFEADHTMTWNSDPERWRQTVLNWLTPRV